MRIYSVADFGTMIGDRVRMTAYQQAIAASVRPGDVVLDVGTGTGIVAMLAVRHGAKRVYAVEPSEAIQVARETAAANGMQDRIVFIQALSSRAKLPERADLMVEDLRGSSPLGGTHLLDVRDARERLLKPGARIISARDTLYCAAVNADDWFGKRFDPWRMRPEGLDLSAAARYVANAYVPVSGGSHSLTAGVAWASIEYATVSSPHVRGGAELVAGQAGTAHGLLLWFDSELAPGVILSNAPDKPDTVYGRRFFPWPQPVPLEKGARMDVEIRADLVGEDYVWTWETDIRLRGESGAPDFHFRQSTFLGEPVTPESLARRAAGHRPKLSAEGRATQFVLERMRGDLPLAEIAAELAAKHADRFRSQREALDFVASLSGTLGE